MSTLVRRFLIVLAVSTAVGLAMTPLGDSELAEGVRAKRAERRETRQRDRVPAKAPPARHVIGPLVKVTVLMGVPAGLLVLVAAGIRRVRR